jgi:parallel beta-helix repeat protein
LVPLLIFLSFCKKEVTVSTTEELLEVLEYRKPVTIRLRAGDYHLSPVDLTEPTCGNCEDPNTEVSITVGIAIETDRVRLIGPKGGKPAVIHTHSGYGIFIDGANGVLLENLVVTDGVRDRDANATDAAIVVKNSEATIRNCLIRDNIGDPDILREKIVGVMGITGREGSKIRIEGNRIIRNSWDGIALYRGAEAIITGNIIDGVDKATGREAGGGRGVAIGITWNGKAVIVGNLVTRYWKGIGLFVDAHATVRENIIEEMLTWGIAYWDAGKGKPAAFISDNAVYDTGACGVSLTRSSPGDNPGHLISNAVVRTARNPAYDASDYYCYQCALAEQAVPDNFEISGNIFYDNRRATEDLPDHDLSREEFEEKVLPLIRKLKKHESLRDSKFLEKFGR